MAYITSLEAINRLLPNGPRRINSLNQLSETLQKLSYVKTIGNDNLLYVIKDNTNNKTCISPANDRFQSIFIQFDGDCNLDEAPELVTELISCYNDAVLISLEDVEDNLEVSSTSSTPYNTDLEHLLSLQWHQNVPFTSRLIFENYNNGLLWEYTGCGTTACALILCYYGKQGYSIGCKKITPYTPSNKQSVYVNITLDPVQNFDWDNMDDYYDTHKALSDKDYAVAELHRYVAPAIKSYITYSSDGKLNSTAANLEHDILNGLVEKFNMHADFIHLNNTKSIKELTEEDYSGFKNRIKNSIISEHPIIIIGYNTLSNNSLSGGHAFILDGYCNTGEQDLFHINFGYDDSRYNAWTSLDALVYYTRHYQYYLQAIVDIYPNFERNKIYDLDDIVGILKSIDDGEYNSDYDVNDNKILNDLDSERIASYILNGSNEQTELAKKCSLIVDIRKNLRKIITNLSDMIDINIQNESIVWIGTLCPTILNYKSIYPIYNNLKSLDGKTITINNGELLYLLCPKGMLTEESRISGNIVEGDFIYKFLKNPDNVSIPGYSIYLSLVFDLGGTFSLKF